MEPNSQFPGIVMVERHQIGEHDTSSHLIFSLKETVKAGIIVIEKDLEILAP